MNRTLESKADYLLPPLVLDLLARFRVELHFQRYKRLLAANLALKDKHRGERCFILGSGPSVKSLDLQTLRDEPCIVLNNFYAHDQFPKLLGGLAPKYYLIAPLHPPQTGDEYARWLADLDSHVPAEFTFLLGLSPSTPNVREIEVASGVFSNKQRAHYLPGINSFVPGFALRRKYLDPSRLIMKSQTASIFALTYAHYLGFSSVILLGMDHNYIVYDAEQDMRFYHSAIHQNNEFERTFGNSFHVLEWNRQYRIFLQYEMIRDQTQLDVINASPHSLLRVFPRTSLDQILRNQPDGAGG